MQSIVGFVAPLIGAQALTLFEGTMPLANAYKGVFLVTMALRFVSVFLATRSRRGGRASSGTP